MDLLGAIGGVFEISVFVFGIFLMPISEHSFIVSSARKLFHVKSTKDESQDFLTVPRGDFAGFKIITISFIQNLKLYISNKLCCCCAKNTYGKIFEHTTRRLKAELNVIKVIKSLRNFRILNK